MKKLSRIGLLTLFALIWTIGAAEAGPYETGLGLFGGATFPLNTKDMGQKFDITEAWGLFVDIRLISTFYVTPQTTIYRLKIKKHDGPTSGIADVSMNFKYVIPLAAWEIFLAPTIGVSTGSFLTEKNDSNDYKSNPIQPHLGGQLGVGVKIISNLDFFLAVQYKYIIDNDQDGIHLMQGLGGLRFNFY